MAQEVPYKIMELEERDGALWARLEMQIAPDTDLPLEAVLQEFGRRIEPHGLKASEAINWVMTIPGLDQFFAEIVEHKKRVMQ